MTLFRPKLLAIDCLSDGEIYELLSMFILQGDMGLIVISLGFVSDNVESLSPFFHFMRPI